MPEPTVTPEPSTAPTYDELRTALFASVQLQTHYAALLNMHDGGERVGFPDPAAWIARLRETGTLPARPALDVRKGAVFAQFQAEHPDRAERMAAEIDAIMAGRCHPVEFQLDPFTAYQLAGAVDLAQMHPEMPERTRTTLDTIYAGIVERIGPQCPELAQQLADGHRQRQQALQGER